MRWRRDWLAVLVPAATGLGLALTLQSGRLRNPLLYLQADLGTLLLLAGLLLSGMALETIVLGALAHRRLERVVTEEREGAAEAHRRFIQQLDHELKNPLTAIRVGLANLTGALLEEGGQDVLTSVEGQVGRLGQLVADLRKLAELEARPLERAPVDVGKLLEEAVEQARQRPAAAERRLELSVRQAPWPLPLVSGDEDLLFLAVYNLLDNAIKFTCPGDRVEVRAFEDRGIVAVEVADTGMGIPADELPHIFEPLFRGQGAQGTEGSGLGLALVKTVVERHSGTVSVHSRPKQGSIFTLRLPVG